MPKLNGNDNKYINGLKVDKESKDVIYSDEAHLYIDKFDSQKYTSVTTLIGKYENPFDIFFWSSYKAAEKLLENKPEVWSTLKETLLASKKWNDSIAERVGLNLTLFDTTRAQIQKEYDDKKKISCERGTKIHAEFEELYYNSETHNLKKFGLGGTFTCKKGYYELDIDKGIYPEFLISLKSKDEILRVAGQIDLLIKDGNDIHIIDYKGLPLNTIIPTKEGFKLLSDVKIGDKLFDKDGKITTVLHKSEVHNNPCYKIKFDNSEEIVADEDHRWLISFGTKNTSYNSVVMTTKELYNYLQTRNSRNSLTIPKILNCASIECDEIELPIDPYVLGVWLGDGSKDCGIITQSTNSPLFKEIINRGYELSDNLIHDEKRKNVESRTIYGLRTLLRSLDLLKNKHIPDIYLRASFNQRLDLLRGYMDTDGYFHKTRKRFVMATTSYQQARDIVKLVSTFGIKPTMFEANKWCDGKKFLGYDVCFATDKFNPFLIRNQDIELPTSALKDYRNIKSVVSTECVPTQCLEVDSPSHTFCVTESMIVTHNTNKEIKKHSFYDKSKFSRVMMKYPLNNIEDCNFWHYTLQLSLYAYLLQQINPAFNIKELKLIHIDHDNNITEYQCEYLKADVERMLKHYKKALKQTMTLDRDKPIVF